METSCFFTSLYLYCTILHMVLPKHAGEPHPQQSSLVSAENTSARFQGSYEGFSRQKNTLKALEQSLTSSSMKTESSLQADEPLLLHEVTLIQRLMYLKPQSPYERC